MAFERMPPFGSPLLFELLNEMDGLDEDADIAFVLTTNRADVLEPALAARPGRVDEAVEIPLPDTDGRRRLLELYGVGANLHLRDPETVIERTSGVTASFVKELIRRAALAAARTDGATGPVTITDEHLAAALDVLLDEGASLARSLLGMPGEMTGGMTGEPPGEDQAGPAPATPSAVGWFAYAPLGRHRGMPQRHFGP